LHYNLGVKLLMLVLVSKLEEGCIWFVYLSYCEMKSYYILLMLFNNFAKIILNTYACNHITTLRTEQSKQTVEKNWHLEW